MIEQSVPFPGLVLALGTVVAPGVPVESHFPWTQGEERKKKKGEDKHEPWNIVKRVDNVKPELYLFRGGVADPKSCLEEVKELDVSNFWHAVLFLFSELTELVFHTLHYSCCSFRMMVLEGLEGVSVFTPLNSELMERI